MIVYAQPQKISAHFLLVTKSYLLSDFSGALFTTTTTTECCKLLTEMFQNEFGTLKLN